MVEFQYTMARRGSIALVAGVLDDRDTVSGVNAYRVQIGVHIDGPIWFPSADAQTRRDDNVIDMVLPAGGVRGVGVAGRGTPADPPLEVLDVEPTSETDRPTTPLDVLRVLGTPIPPRAAVPAAPSSCRDSTGPAPSTPTTHRSSSTVPSAVDAWFDAVEARLDADTLAASDHRRLSEVHTRATRLINRTRSSPRR